MKHILPTDLVNKVLNYLASKPYTEVSAMINEIQSSAIPYVEEGMKEEVNIDS